MTSPPETAPIPARGRISPDPGPLAVWGALLIVYVVWGSTYLGIRIAVNTLPALLSSGLRFVVAGLILGGILAMRGGFRRLKVTRSELLGGALVGTLLLGFGNGGVVLAEADPPGGPVPSGVAALLVALVPLLVVIMRAATGDRPRPTSVVGVLIGFGGLAALVLSRGGSAHVPVVGALMVLGAATSWAAGSVLSQRVSLPADPFVAAVYETIIGGAGLFLLGLVRREPVDLGAVSGRSWLALAYLTTFGSLIAFTAYAWLLRHARISLTSTYAYVNPVVAVALGALVVDERVTLPIVLGGAVIVAGVALVVSTERPARSGATGDPSDASARPAPGSRTTRGR